MEKDNAKITITTDVRNDKGEIQGKVKALMESNVTGKNLAKVFFTDKGIEELEKELGLLAKDTEIKVLLFTE